MSSVTLPGQPQLGMLVLVVLFIRILSLLLRLLLLRGPPTLLLRVLLINLSVHTWNTPFSS